MKRSRLIATFVLAATLGLTACTSQAASPTIHFVGNDTCPTSGQQPYDPSPPGFNDDNPVGTAIDEMPHTHVDVGTIVQYNHNPPTSGCHYNIAGSATQQSGPVEPGVYNQEVADEYWVHNLEHGYIVVLYNCPNNSCANDFQTLTTWYKGLPNEPNYTYPKVVVMPFKEMPVKFAVVSWDWYLGMPSLDMTKIQAFYDDHKGHAPEPNGG